MKELIALRVRSVAEYMISTNKTIREIAKEYRISKSTIHKDLTERLYELDKDKHKKISTILDYHTKIRHIRGGESTRKKYKNK